MSTTQRIPIEVVWGNAQTQQIISLLVRSGTTMQALLVSLGLSEQAPAGFGVFGQSVDKAYELQAGDRVELYQPLQIDPKTRRARLVETKRKAST